MTPKKKITILTMHTGFGGIERFVATLANTLAQHYELTILTNYGQPSDAAFKYANNVTIKYLQPHLPAMVSMKNLIKIGNPAAISRELARRRKLRTAETRALKTALTNLETDIIITERAHYNRAVQKYLKNPKVLKIATDHNYHQNNKKYIKTLISSLRGFDYLVVATKELRDFYLPKIHPTQCLLIGNPLATIPTKKTTFKHPNLISSGRFSPEKAFPDLIKVMALVHQQLPKTKLYLLGDGPEKPTITKDIQNLSLKDHVILPGFIRHEDLPPYFYDSSLFVMTSHTEAFALVLSEAMSYGLPAIAFDSASGARAQITSATGILIKNRDHSAMATAIVKLLKDPTALKNYQKTINPQITRLDPATILKQWQKILD